jgi:hypothetical protein
MTVAVLLADDRRPWRPAPDAEALWVRLRLLCVAAVFFVFFFFFPEKGFTRASTRKDKP